MNEINTKLLKVTLEYEDKIMTLEGEEAEKWNNHNLAVAQFAQFHNLNPFQNNPINWNIKQKQATVYEWLQKLPEPIRLKAIKNLDLSEKDYLRDNLGQALYAAFVFEESPEGHDYWANVAYSYESNNYKQK